MFPRKENENMSTTTKQAINLMELLPESEQNFALEFIKKTCYCMGSGFYKGNTSRKSKVRRSTKRN